MSVDLKDELAGMFGRPTRPPALNRAQRRAEKRANRGKTNPSPLRPVTVSQEVPVTILSHGDGSREVVNHAADEPCYDCRCCALWARSLDQLAVAIKTHEAEAHAQLEDGLHDRNCAAVLFDRACSCVSRDPDCLVCSMIDGQLDAPSTGVDGG